MPKKRVINSIEDAGLWQRVTAQVKPLKSTTRLFEPETSLSNIAKPQDRLPKKTAKAEKNAASANNSNLSATTPKKVETSKQIKPVDLRHGETGGIDRGTQRRFFRGEIPIESRLDLHGMTAARAQNQLAQFIESSAYRGCRCVLVITGKGLGVLHGHVPNWLKTQPLSSHILALAEARPKDGGSGALYVLLRRNRVGQ